MLSLPAGAFALAMHIPDGFLSPGVIGVTTALAGAGLAVALFHANRTLPARKTPLLGLSAAFVFAAQMMNFPVAGGTSGHLVGATLVAVLLGPSAAVIVLTAVLLTQALLYGDGGVTALGANVFNMALVGGVVGYAAYHVLRRFSSSPAWRFTAAGAAAWLATVSASVSCAAQLAASGKVPLRAALSAMAGWHALIGVGEAVITVMVLSAIAAARPELLAPEPGPRPRSFYWSTAAYGTLLALAVALFASPFASDLPDGLDYVAEKENFKDAERKAVAAPMDEYKLPPVRNDSVSKGLAGGIGTLAAFAAAAVIVGGAALLTRRDKPAGDTPAGA